MAFLPLKTAPLDLAQGEARDGSGQSLIVFGRPD